MQNSYLRHRFRPTVLEVRLAVSSFAGSEESSNWLGFRVARLLERALKKQKRYQEVDLNFQVTVDFLVADFTSFLRIVPFRAIRFSEGAEGGKFLSVISRISAPAKLGPLFTLPGNKRSPWDFGRV